jgi:hypothetical protein
LGEDLEVETEGTGDLGLRVDKVQGLLLFSMVGEAAGVPSGDSSLTPLASIDGQIPCKSLGKGGTGGTAGGSIAESKSPDSLRAETSLKALTSLLTLLLLAALEAVDRPPIKLGEVIEVIERPSFEVKRLAEEVDPRWETLDDEGSTELTTRWDLRLVLAAEWVATRGLEAAEEGDDKVELAGLSCIALASSSCSLAERSLTELLLRVRCRFAIFAVSSLDSRIDCLEGVPVRLRGAPGKGGGLF